VGDRTQCAELAELLAEVATGVASGPDRARVLRHLSACDDCRRELDDLTQVADEVLLITPERESPAGFEGAVLDRIAALTPPAEPVARRRWGFWRPVLYAAAASIFAIAGAGVAWQATSDERELAAAYQNTLDVADGRYFSAVDLVGMDGMSAGTAFVYDGSPSWLFVVVRDAPAGTYDVILTAGGRSATVATCTVDQSTCSVGVTLDPGTYPVDEVRLVSPDGTTLRSEQG